jgi:hypothetical protein
MGNGGKNQHILNLGVRRRGLVNVMQQQGTEPFPGQVRNLITVLTELSVICPQFQISENKSFILTIYR